ncbi:MAG TPA: putative N-acetylmannosamine-6-phosphate 2-epimerase [Candidatus Baltobacteraceae bacterium]
MRGLIVSIQPPSGSALDDPAIVAAMAASAAGNGAVAVRIEGVQRIKAVRARLPQTPIVGLIKHAFDGFAPYITATLSDVEKVLSSGANIVAVDATSRPRSDGSTVADAIAAIHARNGIVFADCARIDDARASLAGAADVLATTLCGYTDDTRGAALPALDLVAAISTLGAFTVCEGGVASPAQAASAFAHGASAVVVGTALTNLDVLVRRYADTAPRSHDT